MSSAAGSTTGDPQRSSRHPTAGRAYIGLGILGWGLSILLRVAPHEDPVVGAGLAVLGAALLVTAPILPRVDRLPSLLVAGIGIAAAGAVVAYDWWFRSPLNVTKAALIVWGVTLVALSPFLRRDLPLPFRRVKGVPVATLAAYMLPVLGAPLAVWAIQATFEGMVGTTPVEAFIKVFLLVPLAAVLTVLGWHPAVAGQTITYDALQGPIRVDVGAACSGVQAMALFGGVLALFLFIERPNGRRLALWGAIGLGGVYVANLVRLVAITVVGHRWGAEALLQTHEQAGWIFFVAWAILFAWLARRTSDAQSRGSGPAGATMPSSIPVRVVRVASPNLATEGVGPQTPGGPSKRFSP